MPGSIKRSLGLDADDSEVSGALNSDALDQKELSLGRWDGARASLWAVDWQNSDAEPIRFLGGEIGSVSIEGQAYSAELRGAADRLDAPVCPATSPECRAQFGDRQCRVNLAGRTTRAKILSTDGTTLLLDCAVEERFLMGRLRYLSGENCGARTTILAVDGATVTVRDLPRGTLEPGARVQLLEGCDKRLTTCAARFDNAVNFRAEPHLPGTDLLTRYPGA